MSDNSGNRSTLAHWLRLVTIGRRPRATVVRIAAGVNVARPIVIVHATTSSASFARTHAELRRGAPARRTLLHELRPGLTHGDLRELRQRGAGGVAILRELRRVLA